MPGYYFDWNAREISLEQWMALRMRPFHVGLTDLGRLGRVSTVWLGLDHGFGSGPPVIFETMVFGGPLDQEMERYCTWESAVTGHEFMVMRLTSLAGKTEKTRPLIHKGHKPKGAGFRGF
jgi:hypothetical protein